jgi:hypothetical protein
MSKLNGRLETLSLIADRGIEISYSDTGFVSPNRWVSNAIVHDFLERGLIERFGTQAKVTQKGIQVLNESRKRQTNENR